MIKNVSLVNKIGGYRISTKVYLPDCAFDKVVIVCHGIASHQKRPAVAVVAQKLMKNGICAVTFDFPGHGSSKAFHKLSVGNCMADILHLIGYIKRKYNTQDITLFATSFGGYIALNFILNYPHIVSRLFLRAPAIDMKNILINKLIGVPLKQYKSDGYVRIGYKNRLLIPYDFYKNLCNYDLCKGNQKIQIPVFIIQGKIDDTADIKDTYMFLKRRMPHAKLMAMEDMKHVISVEQIEMVANCLIKFLKEAN